ncbi:MAG: helix-turn-helix domain-containing protein [Phycisphaerales bacterium]
MPTRFDPHPDPIDPAAPTTDPASSEADAGPYALALRQRLRRACGDCSVSDLARQTGFNRETTRRYMLGQRPDIEFVARVAELFGCSGEWLLTGRGPERVSHADEGPLSEACEAAPADILGVVGMGGGGTVGGGGGVGRAGAEGGGVARTGTGAIFLPHAGRNQRA